MANYSFDIESEYDKAEINNVLDQVKREITARYDFKGTAADIEWLNDNRSGFRIVGDGDWQIDAIIDIVRKKLAIRQQSQKILDTSHDITTSNLKSTKEVPFVRGLDQDKAKKITKLLRDELPKVKTQIQGETVRVTSNNKDSLQSAIGLLKTQDYDFPINFTNYR